MATRAEKDAAGYTVYRATESRTIPNLDLLTFLFDSPYGLAKDDTPLHVSAADPSISVNKAQYRRLTKSTAYTLRNTFGIGASGPGKDVVTVILPGHHLVAALLYSTVAAGGVFSGASQAFTPTELARQLKLSNSKLLICHANTKATALAAAKQIGFPPERVLILGDATEVELTVASNSRPVKTGDGELDWERITDQSRLENSLIVLIYSSGTTGLPKGVEITHMNIVAETIVAQQPLQEFNLVCRPGYQYRTIGHLPINHIAGLQGYLVNPFYQGGTVFWMPKFDFPNFLKYCKRHKINYFFSVPPIFLLIAKSPLVKDHFDTMVGAVSGAAPLGKETQNAASKKLGKGTARISQTWGLTETTGSMSILPQGWKDDSGSVSCLVANSTIRLVDDDGNDVPVGQRGEIICKGPIVTRGYYNNPQANKDSFRDGWYCTGDIAEFRNGLFYIVDRKKELIKYKGIQVAPAELEALLLSNSKIQDAAVIGVEAEGTEVPRAYVVADKKKISAEDIMNFVKRRVAGHKQLRGGVIFLEAIPKTPSGKILRKDLREMARKESSAKL